MNARRLTLARERRGLTKTELAKRLNVELRTVTGWEAGDHVPSREAVWRIAAILGFPVAFFEGDDLEELTPSEASFRSLSKMTAAQRGMALAQGALALHLNRWLESKFSLPVPDLPDLSRETDPEAAADSLRKMWGLGQLSIRNMIHLLEAKGVRVYSLAIETREVDAFSLWKGGIPFILLNSYKSGEHSRFDAAHELAHLVLHRHSSPNGRQAERDADRFASAFLMPRGDVIARCAGVSSLDEIVKRKTHWAVSVMALAHRLHGIGILTDWAYRSICISATKRGYRTDEPNGIQKERSLILPKLLAAIYEDDGISRTGLADALSISTNELEQMLFGLVMTGIDGGRNPTTKTVTGRAKLTRLK